MRGEFHGRIPASLRQLRAMHPTKEFEVVHVQFFGQRLQDGVAATSLVFRHRRLFERRKRTTSHRGLPGAMEPVSFDLPSLQRARVSFLFDPVDVGSRHRRGRDARAWRATTTFRPCSKGVSDVGWEAYHVDCRCARDVSARGRREAMTVATTCKRHERE